MLTRILTAIVALLLLVPLLIWGGTWGACALFALIAGFSVYEMLGCCGMLKKWAVSLSSIAISAFIALLPAWGMDIIDEVMKDEKRAIVGGRDQLESLGYTPKKLIKI